MSAAMALAARRTPHAEILTNLTVGFLYTRTWIVVEAKRQVIDLFEFSGLEERLARLLHKCDWYGRADDSAVLLAVMCFMRRDVFQ